MVTYVAVQCFAQNTQTLFSISKYNIKNMNTVKKYSMCGPFLGCFPDEEDRRHNSEVEVSLREHSDWRLRVQFYWVNCSANDTPSVAINMCHLLNSFPSLMRPAITGKMPQIWSVGKTSP